MIVIASEQPFKPKVLNHAFLPEETVNHHPLMIKTVINGAIRLNVLSANSKTGGALQHDTTDVHIPSSLRYSSLLS